MNDISIVTSEKDLPVKYGMYNLGEERDAARASLMYIYSDMTDIKKGYFRLGFHLNEFRECKYYRDFGYITFEEFCEANFSMDKGAVSRCINVFLMTTAYGEWTFKNGVEIRGCASQMSEKYNGYSYSQLTEMLPLSEEQRRMVKPDMTVKQIRALKKEGKNKKVATSQPEVLEEAQEEIVIKYGDFQDDNFIADALYRVKQFIYSTNIPVQNMQTSGKRLYFEDLQGNKYAVTYSVTKKKEG